MSRDTKTILIDDVTYEFNTHYNQLTGRATTEVWLGLDGEQLIGTSTINYENKAIALRINEPMVAKIELPWSQFSMHTELHGRQAALESVCRLILDASVAINNLHLDS